MTSTSLLLDAVIDMRIPRLLIVDCWPYISDAGIYEISKPLNTAVGSASASGWISSETSCMQIEEWQKVFLCLFFRLFFASAKCFEKYSERIKRKIFEC